VSQPRYECTLCGACCVALDISTLGKPVGVPCKHLGPDLRCTIYETRPKVCRDYQADADCETIAAPTLAQRVAKLRALYGV
jgi:Fe-S-cluster containining protein